jgi:hypothetical protein
MMTSHSLPATVGRTALQKLCLQTTSNGAPACAYCRSCGGVGCRRLRRLICVRRRERAQRRNLAWLAFMLPTPECSVSVCFSSLRQHTCKVLGRVSKQHAVQRLVEALVQRAAPHTAACR